VIIVDTSGLVAAMFEDQRYHEECARILQEDEGPIILSPFVFAEADYLVNKYGGIEAELAFLEEVERGAYLLVPFETHLIPDTRRMVHRYRDLNIGLTDASLIMLSEKWDCRDILTLDLRHFRAIRPPTRRSLRLLPADLTL